MKKKPKLYEVATAHLDTVWNWTLEDTVEKYLKATLDDNFALLEKYPLYKFNFEGAYRYQLIREYYPEQYEKMKEYIRQGRWFVTGSSWENGDVVTPSPEALMRNILYGNRFFEQEFGKKSNDIFLPDCFGFPCTLPTIMRHMGLKAFSSQKLTWNEGHTPPFHVGIWQGIDGSEVVAALNPGAYTTVVREKPSENRELYETTAALPLGKDLRYFGTGDIGGAPTDESARLVSEAAADADGLNEVISAYAGQLVDELTDAEKAQLPRTDEELLMITHGVGSYTSVAPTKRFHRSNELKADFAERSCVFAAWLGARDYPAETLRKAWRDFIRHEFHDDLTGTSVQRAYRETFHDDIIVNNTLDGEIGAALCAIAANVDTGAGDGEKLVVFNPTAYDRRDTAEAVVSFGGARPAYVRVIGPDGRETPSQIAGDAKDGVKIWFRASVPAQGYAVYRALPAQAPFAGAALSVCENALENDRLAVRINADGDIASIYDKVNGREMLDAPIRYQILKNSFRGYGAWEIGYDDLIAAPQKIVGGPYTARVTADGPCRVALEIVRTSDNSRFTQVLSLDADSDYLNVYNDINWTESRAMLKAAFPLRLAGETAVYDAGLGSVERPDRNPDKYEVPVHKWANMYDREQDYSVTLLNDCKYAMDKYENTLRLTCIHTPANRFMDETRQDLQDFGQNVFSFAIRGGQGDFRATAAERAGNLYNSALAVCRTGAHGGVLPSVYSFFNIDNENVSVKAIKKAEDTDEIIVRVCESAGRPASGSFSLGDGVASAREVNGYEEPVGAAAVSDGRVAFTLKPFEPKTFAVRLREAPADARRAAYTAIPVAGGQVFTACRTQGGVYGIGADHTAIPRELIGNTLTACGVPFSFCEAAGELACLIPAGETIAVPEGATALHMLAARSDADGTYAVLADGREIRFGVQSYADDIGGWDQYGSDHYGFIREDRVAFSTAHTRDNGGDRVYGRFAWYLYSIDLPAGTKQVVLPRDDGMMIAALTAQDASLPFAAVVSDAVIHKKQKTPRTVRVSQAVGGGAYVAGNPVYLAYDGETAGVVSWRSSDGSAYTGMSCSFDMPDADLDITASIKPYFKKLPRAERILAENTDSDCPAANLVDGRADTLWRAATDGKATALVDLGVKRRFSHLVLYHSGACKSGQTQNIWYRSRRMTVSSQGNQTLNTFAYAVQYLDDGVWKPLADVDGNILPITQHDFDEVFTRFIRIEILTPTRCGNDGRASLTGLELYADADYGEETEQDPVTAYDIAESSGGAEILFDGECREGGAIEFPHAVVVTGWRVEGASGAAVAVDDAKNGGALTDEGADVVTPGLVNRLLPEIETRRLTVTRLTAAGDKPRVTVFGRSFALSPIKRYKAAECGGTRNPGAEKLVDGAMRLQAAEGSGHDLYGFDAQAPAGDITFAIRVRIHDNDLFALPDDTPLFEFNPVFPNGDLHGEDITVGDYKNAPADGNGYRTLRGTFLNTSAGRSEGRITNYRNVAMEVLDFTFYSGRP